MASAAALPLGATCLDDDRCRFVVWAPKVAQLSVHLVAPVDRVVPLTSDGFGYFHGVLENVPVGARYFYRLGVSHERPDPASRFQPEGVHGPSEVVSLPHIEDGAWHGLPLADFILYELHVGTFTPEGTFAAAIDHLDTLKELGVTALQLMPVAQFPGRRNWGYDGAYPFAVQSSYGGPDGLAKLVEACHARGMAVALDVVYNHLGPEGNYLREYGHYFTDRYRTPWGAALNFDGPHSDEVRCFFIENALYWIRDFHIDMLRLDAVHAIHDESARPFLRELAAAVHAEADRLHRRVWVVEESNRNDPRHIRSVEAGGWGLDAVWMDDFHHCVHAVLTGERGGYYRDFGSLSQLAKAFREGFVFTGERSHYRGRRHGDSSVGVPPSRFVVYSQNHDQVGNRLHGERLAELVSFEKLKLAAGLALLSPYLPMLFMGEEYGEKAPFLYFVEHSDPDLIAAVRRGRQEEFSSFAWQGEIPDPQSENTFRRCLLDRSLRNQDAHAVLWKFYQRLISLRKQTPALARPDQTRRDVQVFSDSQILACRRSLGASEVCIVYSLDDKSAAVRLPLPEGAWRKTFDSADVAWRGPGSVVPECLHSDGMTSLSLPFSSFVLLTREL